MTSCYHDNGWLGKAMRHEPTCWLIMKCASFLLLSLSQKKDKLTVMVPQHFVSSMTILCLYVFLVGLQRPTLICNVGVEDTQILVRCLASLNQYLINPLDVIVQALIASRGYFPLNVATVLLVWQFLGGTAQCTVAFTVCSAALV